jgi:hypothetical protein
VIKDSRAVLCANVCALAVWRGRVVDGEEDIEQVAKRDDGWIEFDLHSLGMTRVPAADCAVGGVVDMAACVARFHGMHAFDFIENGFQAPETSPGQRRGLKIGCHDKFSFFNIDT